MGCISNSIYNFVIFHFYNLYYFFILRGKAQEVAKEVINDIVTESNGKLLLTAAVVFVIEGIFICIIKCS